MSDRKPEIYPDDQVPEVCVVDYETECDDAPTYIMIDNVCFIVDGVCSGDYPLSSDKAKIEEVKSVIKRLQLALDRLEDILPDIRYQPNPATRWREKGT